MRTGNILEVKVTKIFADNTSVSVKERWTSSSSLEMWRKELFPDEYLSILRRPICTS
ncbi:hypothetical protein LCGC14_1740280 [marine sediment metagenome]|uniref:Uncharacterized protein n=1 Tax=marine sediment metagenome TaxID=412755 RepID=A0A0F9H6W6_9ZZZZ